MFIAVLHSVLILTVRLGRFAAGGKDAKYNNRCRMELDLQPVCLHLINSGVQIDMFNA
jgi:hypothetical protein